MCGFFNFVGGTADTMADIVSRRDAIAATIRRRGPDHASEHREKDVFALHTLLSMTGPASSQPVVDDRMLLVFNGEIYNDYLSYTDAYGDTKYLSGRLRDEGAAAFSSLDGEFAICYLDRARRKLYLAADPMGTKPLYYQLGDGYVATGSYASTVAAAGQPGEILQVCANTLLEIDLRTFSVASRTELRKFDFGHPVIDSFEPWNAAFAEAIQKRTRSTRHHCFVSLSAGHDSGIIAAELLRQKVPFAAYVAPFKEDPDVLRRRLALLGEAGVPVELIEPTAEEFERMRALLHAECEAFSLVSTESSFRNFADPDFRNNPGFIVSGIIHEKARAANRLISLSGQGGDEIYSDYYNEHSNSRMSELRGDWSRATRPWSNFNQGWNRALIGGGERVAGAFGVETRYPLLDPAVAQAFLSLTPKLKGMWYKSPLTNRLRELGFPHHMRKQGFAGFAAAG